MSDTKFVPGPWEINEGKYGVIFPVRDEESGIRASISLTVEMLPAVYLSSAVTQETMQATAHLIAAAPELYDALVDALKVIADENYSDESYAAFQNAQATLAKARGEVTA